VFFCSSRRRHTRSKRDWSSDVCSSDLEIRKTTTNTVTNHGYRVDCTGMNRMLSPLFSAVAVADLLVMKYIFAPEVVTWKLCIFRHTARTPKQRRRSKPACSQVATAASRKATLRVRGA